MNCKLSGYYITLSSNMYRGMDMYGYLNNVTGTGRGDCEIIWSTRENPDFMRVCAT